MWQPMLFYQYLHHIFAHPVNEVLHSKHNHLFVKALTLADEQSLPRVQLILLVHQYYYLYQLIDHMP